MSFSLIIFDYDGVLIDSLDDAVNVGQEFCQSVSHDRALNRETIKDLEDMTYYELARSLGFRHELVDKFALYVFERFQAIGPSMAFFPEIESLLHRIASKNIAIVSGNARDVIYAKLTAHGLGDKIDCIYGAHEAGNKAEKIRNACSHFGVTVEQACMVGDSISDIRYAKQAGVQSVAATWGWHSHAKLAKEEPDYIVNNVQELSGLIDLKYQGVFFSQ